MCFRSRSLFRQGSDWERRDYDDNQEELIDLSRSLFRQGSDWESREKRQNYQ